ncbi:MAG: PASTA domain-containing protein [Egibacteraceae bacterium]
MTALLLLGIALAGFGVLTLFKFPDRPGGTIRLHRMEISSAGAGLPLIAFGITAMAFSAVGAGLSDGGTLPPPIARPSPTSTSSETTSPAAAGDWVGRLVDPVTRELVASGVAVSEVPVVDASKREGEIVAQDPAPGEPLGKQTTLKVIRNPGRIDLLACCVQFIDGQFSSGYWRQLPAEIGRQRYDTTLRWTYGGPGNDGVAIPLSADQRITRLTAVVGIANDADVSNETQATVVVKIEGIETMRRTVTVANPLPLDLPVAHVSRVELLFTGVNVPVVIADLTGHRS